MTTPVELVDSLRPVRADGVPGVHLASYDWPSVTDPFTLCGLSIVSGSPRQTYLKTGCLTCAHRAVETGVYAVYDSEHFVVNLRRLIRSSLPSWPGSSLGVSALA